MAAALAKFVDLREAKDLFEGATDLCPNNHPFYDYSDSSTWQFSKHPFCDFLSAAGYHSVMLVHPDAEDTQFGSYEIQTQNQKFCQWDVYYVFAQDEGGKVITDKEDPNTGVVKEFEVIKDFRTKLASESTMRQLRKVYFDGHKWQVMKRFAKTQDVGATIACKTKKLKKIDAPGWSSRVEQTHMCWQAFDDQGTPFGEATWEPQLDLEVGMDLVVTKDSTFFFNAISPHEAYWDNATWDTHLEQTLGQKCKVVEVLENKNIAKVEITVDDQTVTWPVPGECLLREEAGETALLMSEVGQYVLVAQLDLFDTKTHAARSRNINPIVTEWTSLIGQMTEFEESGMMDNSGDQNNLKPAIAAWQTNNPDWEWS